MIALRLFAAATLLIALIQTWCVTLSLLEVRMTHTLAVAGAVVAATGAALFAAVARSRPAERPAPDPAFDAKVVRIVGGIALVGLLAWTGWVASQLLLIAWYRDPLRWDSLWYHVPAINEWAVRGHVFFYPLDPRLVGAPDQVDFAGWLDFPMGVELTGFFVFRLLGTDRLVDATNLWYWCLTIPALAVLGRRLGTPAPWNWVGGALLFGVSEFVRQSATAYVDPAFGGTVIASLAAGVVFVFDRDRPVWWKSVLLGAAVGLMVGSKLPGLPFGGVVALATFVGLLARDGIRSWSKQLVAAVPAVALTVVVGGYWSIRNLVHTGNPIYPIQLQLGRKVIAQGFDLTGFDSGWALASFPFLKPYPAWARMFVAWTQPDLAFRTLEDPNVFLHSSAAGLGYIWLLGGLPAILLLWFLAARRRRRELLGVLAYLTITLVVLLQVLPMTWQARYTYWLHALGLPAFAWVLADAIGRVRRRPLHLVTLGLGAAVIGVAVWESRGTIGLEWRTGRDETAPAQPPRFHTALDLGWPWLKDDEGFGELLAADRVARSNWKVPGDELLNGVLAMPLGKREIVVLPPEPTDAEIEGLIGRGFHWVLWQAENGEDLPPALTGHATRVYRRVGTKVTSFAIRL